MTFHSFPAGTRRDFATPSGQEGCWRSCARRRTANLAPLLTRCSSLLPYPLFLAVMCMGADHAGPSSNSPSAGLVYSCDPDGFRGCVWFVAALPLGELVPKPEECPGRLRGHLRHCSIDVQKESACCFQGHPELAGVRPNPSEMLPLTKPCVHAERALRSPALRE